jgi:hypothetical protein
MATARSAKKSIRREPAKTGDRNARGAEKVRVRETDKTIPVKAPKRTRKDPVDPISVDRRKQILEG